MRAALALCVLLLTSPCGAQTLEAFGYALSLEVAPASGLARVVLPVEVYEGSAKDALADLRVFDADGRPAPFALEPRAVQEAATRWVPLTLFPMYSRGDGPVQGARVRISTSGSQVAVDLEQAGDKARPAPRSMRGYLVDLGKDSTPLSALRFDWRADAALQVITVSVERSDNLDDWQPVADNVTLARVQAQGQQLVRDDIDVSGAGTRYLRITFPGMPEVPAVTSLRGQFRLEPRPATRQWKEVAGQPEGASERQFDLGGALPIDRVQLVLTGDNAVLPVEILSRRRETDPWTRVTGATFYRIVQGTRTVTNAEVAVPAERHPFWKVRAAQSGSALPPVSLRAGWVPESLVFVTQGRQPYRLAFGHGGVEPAALPVSTVVPGYGTDRAATVTDARIVGRQILAGPSARKPPMDVKRGVLWAVLVGAVALLAWMAWSLARQLKRGEPTG